MKTSVPMIGLTNAQRARGAGKSAKGAPFYVGERPTRARRRGTTPIRTLFWL
jgi:hypothetical protein